LGYLKYNLKKGDEMEELNEKLTASLSGTEFPASKGQLISNASLNGADEDVLRFLDMAEDREYSSMDDLMSEMDMGTKDTSDIEEDETGLGSAQEL
jgi:hypothetical protein